MISLGSLPQAVAADPSPDDQAAANELRDDPALMEETLQKLMDQIDRNYDKPDDRKHWHAALKDICKGDDPARGIVMLQDQLLDDWQEIKPKQRR